MTQKKSLWTRIVHFFAPPRETYDSRQPRPDGDVHPLPEQHSHAADYRRHGGSAATGA